MHPHSNSALRTLGIGVALIGGSASAQAQRPPLAGVVNPRAVAPPVQQPAPIGGLRTTPIGAPRPDARHRGQQHPADRHYPDHRYGYPGYAGVIPLRVLDAPLIRGGAVVINDESHDAVRWYPSAQRPSWRVDSLAPKVDAWRDIFVEDVICTSTGTCLERVTRMRARWSAYCNCYRFADALGRIWRVE